MKIRTYLLAGLAVMAMASCDDSFNDWNQQATNAQKDAVAFGNSTVEAVDLIDFANIAEGTDSVQVCKIAAAPTSSSAAYNSVYTIIFSHLNASTGNTETATLNMSKDGKVAFEELKSYVEATYGKRPTERDMASVVRVTFSNGTTASYLNSSAFTVKVKPQAPVIEEAYYYIGAANNWNTKDQTYKLTNSGRDVYDDPVFSVVVPVVYDENGKRKDNWFKIAPASAYATSDLWASGNIIGAATNGENAASGTFVQGANDKQVFAWNISDDNAKYYRITINLMQRTYEVTALNFAEYIYEVGNNTSWAANPLVMYGPNSDGKYYGAFYLNGEFKFKPNAGNDWSGDWEYNGEGKLLDGGSGNIPAPATGFYFVTVDLSAMTYELKQFSEMRVVGDAVPGGWVDGNAMTWNAADKTWELKNVTLKDGNIKFRSDADWNKVNLGGTLAKLVQNSNNNISVTAGTYDIILHLENKDRAPYAELIVK